MAPYYWITDPEYTGLLNYLIKETENVEAPVNIQQLVREFKEKSGTTQKETCLRRRIEKLRLKIQGFEHIDTGTKVKLMFVLSASVDEDFLEELRKNAFVELDEKNRITKYETVDGSLELSVEDSQSATTSAAKRYSKVKYRKLIEFITEKCDTIDSPLSIRQLTKDFNKNFGMSRTSIRTRIKVYCNEIQRTESLDTPSKVKQLFGLSATLDSDFLKELRKDASVEVDHENRITMYTANDNSLSLRGSHHGSGNTKPKLVRKEEEEKNVMKLPGYERMNDISDEYFNEEFDSDSDDENDHLDEIEDLMESSNGANDFDNETSFRNRSEMSVDINFDFDPPTERMHRSEESEMREDDKNDREITEGAAVKTIFGSLEDVDELIPSRKRKNSSHTLPISGKKRNKDTTKSSSSKRTGSYSNDSMRPNELDDYDPSYSIDNEVKLEPFRGSIQEDLNEKRGDDIQQIQKPLQKLLDEHSQMSEVTIKVEHEEPIIVEDHPEDVKPVTSHNPKIKFFEAMKSLILFLDTPSLSDLQSKIHQKIRKMKGSEEML
ncbi:unnamed protein product [Caenorhabditis brenneri]